VNITRELVRQLTGLGYHVALSYIPRWYWSGHIGSPDLSGLPPLWISRYPDYTVRRKDAALAAAERLGNVWAGYGGLPVAVAQISASGAVADYPNGNIDLNVFNGTRNDLAALLGGDTDMPLTPDDAELVANTLLGKVISVVQTDPKTGAAAGVRDVNIRGILEYADVRAQLAVLTAKNGAGTVLSALSSGLSRLEANVLEAIHAAPTGPGGTLTAAEVEARVRKVFGDAAAGPATV
jgi:hypothetical protein